MKTKPCLGRQNKAKQKSNHYFIMKQIPNNFEYFVQNKLFAHALIKGIFFTLLIPTERS
jgi:hypothetical protein